MSFFYFYEVMKISKKIKLLIIGVFTVILTIFSNISIQTVEIEAATGKSFEVYSKSYGDVTTHTHYIMVGGIPVYCIDPHLYAPSPTGDNYTAEVFNDIGVYNILYYADHHEYHKNSGTFVDVRVALNWYLGRPTTEGQRNDPTVRYLYNKAKNPDAPTGEFSIENRIQFATYQEGNYFQETSWYNPKTDGNNIKYTVKVPSGMSLISENGNNLGSGTITLNQNQKFKLRAPLNFEGTFDLEVDTNVLKSRALLFLPDNSNLQNLVGFERIDDPATVPNITATFSKRTGTGRGFKIDKTTRKRLSGASFSVENLGTFEVGGVSTGDNGSADWGEAVIGERIRITETRAPKGYINNYESKIIEIIGGNSNNVTFENDKMAELQFTKIEIFTDQAKNGLPIVIHTKKIQSSPTADNQYVDVVLYEKDSGKRVLTLPYKIGDLPEKISARIPSKHLAINNKKNYIAEFEFNSKYAYTTPGKGQIDTDGYTSTEEMLSVHAQDLSKLQYSGVIKTERFINQNMAVYNEYFSIPTNKLAKQKTGYGFNRSFQTEYINELNNPTDFSMKVTVDSLLIDTYLPYESVNNRTDIILDNIHPELFELPHVNIERKTGALFTDEQVLNGDSKIENELVDGGRELYVPIWGNIGDYDITTSSTTPIGVNQIMFDINDSLNIYAHMYAHMDSETIELDSIMLSPVLHDHPFAAGIPDNWGYSTFTDKKLTDEELDWFEKDVPIQKIKLTFDLNGGNGSFPNESISIGQSFKLPDKHPTKENYSFEGWKIGETNHYSGEYIKPASDITLIAQWRTLTRNITYNSNGGDSEPINTKVDVGNSYQIPNQIPTKEDYTFIGWKSRPDSPNYQPNQTFVMPNNDINFVAQWAISTQEIIFDLNNGENGPENALAETNSIFVIPDIVPERNGYSFKGWEYETKVYQSGEQLKVGNETITLVAIWDIGIVDITYDGNGGENIPREDTAAMNTSYTIPKDEPSQEFYTFKGWKNSNDDELYQAGDTLDITNKDLEFIAQWDRIQQTVTFDNNGGTSSLTVESVDTNAEYTIPNVFPEKPAHGFEGWEYQGKLYQPEETIFVTDKDITLTAQYEIGRYIVHHDGNGAESNVPEDIYLGEGVPYRIAVIGEGIITEDHDPIREGYTFMGWLRNDDGKIYHAGDLLIINQDTILVAQWEINDYIVSYELNGGDGDFPDIVQNYQTRFTVSDKIPTRDGYTFRGWWRSDTGEVINPKDTFDIPSNNVTLVAQWEINQYTVSFDRNGGSGQFNSLIQDYNTVITVPSTEPTRQYYTFTGWKRSDTGVVVQANDTFHLPSNSLTLVAQWEINKYTVSHDLNNGVGDFKDITQDYNTIFTLSENEPTRVGHTFRYWRRSDNNSIMQPKTSARIPGYDLTLRAQWNINTYTISYNTNGGVGSFASRTQVYDTQYNVLSHIPTKKGHTFKGWERNDTGKIVQANEIIRVPGVDLKLTAQWEVNKYTVSYDLNDGDGEHVSVTQNYDTVFTVSDIEPTREHEGSTNPDQITYTFTGWKRSDNGQIIQPNAKFNIPDKNVTLRAVWRMDKYVSPTITRTNFSSQPSFAEPYQYNQDGFKGSLNKLGSATTDLIADSRSKYVSAQTSSYYSDSDGYSGGLSQYVYDTVTVPDQTMNSGDVLQHTTTEYWYLEVIDGVWQTVDTDNTPYAPGSKHYATNGYSGTVYSGSSYLISDNGYPSTASEGSTYTRIRVNGVYYSGTLTKPGYSYNIYRYRGTVTRPSEYTHRQVYGGFVSKVID